MHTIKKVITQFYMFICVCIKENNELMDMNCGSFYKVMIDEATKVLHTFKNTLTFCNNFQIQIFLAPLLYITIHQCIERPQYFLWKKASITPVFTVHPTTNK